MEPITQYFILKAETPDALSVIVTQAIRENDHKHALGHPFSIVRSNGSAYCLQVVALCHPTVRIALPCVALGAAATKPRRWRDVDPPHIAEGNFGLDSAHPSLLKT